MATVISRRVLSIPARTASETWNKIASLLAPDPNSAGRAELDKIAGVVTSCISSEATKDDPIVVLGKGPQVRIYCLFGDDALSDGDADEDGFQQCPTEGDWRMSVPCPAEDLNWVQKKLRSCSARVTARELGEAVSNEEKRSATSSNSAIVIDRAEFLKI